MAKSALEVAVTVPFISENTRLISVLGRCVDSIDKETGRPTVSRAYNDKFNIIREVVPTLFSSLDGVMEYFSANEEIQWNIRNKNQELYPGGEYDEHVTMAQYPATGLEVVNVIGNHTEPSLTWLNDNRFVYVKYIVRNVEFRGARR